MAMLSTRTKLRAASAAVRTPLRTARRMPRVRSRRSPVVVVPLPVVKIAPGPKLVVPIPRMRPEQPERRHERARMLGAVGGTAVAVYLLDPKQGRRRRHMARDRGLKLLRQAGRRSARRMRYAASTRRGQQQAHTATHRDAELLNDPALARKVESEIFRAADAPKGRVSVNVEQGVVYLRGQLDDTGAMERLVVAAEHVEGVRRVESLLHRPGEPAPAKTEKLDPGVAGKERPTAGTGMPTQPAEGPAGEAPPEGGGQAS